MVMDEWKATVGKKTDYSFLGACDLKKVMTEENSSLLTSPLKPSEVDSKFVLTNSLRCNCFH